MSTIKNTINYYGDSLMICIPTNSPAALHQLLMKGINVALKQYAQLKNVNENDVEGLIALSDLQNALIPTEHSLECAYQVS